MYQVLSPANRIEAQTAWCSARDANACLVVLPPVSSAESQVLLRQLPERAPSGANLAIFSSGSEGDPKAIFHSDESLRASANQVANWLQSSSGILCTLSPWSMAGFLFGVILNEATACKVHVLSDNPLFAGGELAPLVEQGLVDQLITHPFHLRILLERGELHRLSRPLTVTSFTAPLPASLSEKASAEGFTVQVGYGLSEAAGPVLVEGKSLGAECSLSGQGELVVKGAQMMLGSSRAGVYVAREVPFATGDIFAKVGERLEWSHRIRDVIDVAGRKISPTLIEEIVSRHPDVSDCTAYGTSDAIYGQRVALLLEAPQLRDNSFRDFLAEAFSPELRPTEWRLIDQLPRLASGKKNRRFSSR